MHALALLMPDPCVRFKAGVVRLYVYEAAMYRAARVAAPGLGPRLQGLHSILDAACKGWAKVGRAAKALHTHRPSSP